MIITKDFQTDATGLKLEVQEIILEKLEELPHSLSSFIKNKCILSGGCFASLMHGTTPKDYDFWCLDDADLPDLQRLMHVYSERDSALITVENPAYMNQFVDGKIITANATTLKNGIQLIKLSNYATAKPSFDFEHCKVSYIPATNTLYMSKTQYNSIINKKLVPTREVDMTNTATQRRVAKFTERGWSA
jgi:hypothetical protein